MNRILFTLMALTVLSCQVGPGYEEREDQYYPGGGVKIIGYYSDSAGIERRLGERRLYENGNIEIEGFIDRQGRRTGRWKYFYENGTLWSECDYADGMRHGESRTYYPNGQLRYDGLYENDEPISGSFKYFTQDGTEVSN